MFTVTANAESSGTMTVEYATADDSATAGDDYTSTSGTLTLTAGDRTATIEVTVIDDTDEEQDETFKVRLTNPAGATIENDEGVGTIRDDDGDNRRPRPPRGPTLSIDDVTVDEGARGADFTVTMNIASGQPVTVAYATADGTATAGADYRKTSGTLAIKAGQRTATIRVRVIDDRVAEEDETFTVTLSKATGVAIADAKGVGTIRDDDGVTPPPPPPALRIDDAAVDEDAGTAEFTVRMSAASTEAVSVGYATSDRTAEAGLDYTSTSGTLTIPAGLTVATIAVTVLDDDVAEGDEAFAVILSGATGATIAHGEGIGTIRDDELPAVSVSFGAASYQVAEGESVEVAVDLAPAVNRSVTVPLTHLPGDGATEADYSGVPENLVFESLETRRTFRILATADAETEEGESVVLRFGTLPAGATAGATATSTVILEDSGLSRRLVTKRWLQRFGGTAASHAIDAIDERLRCARYHYSLDATSDHLPGRWKCNPWFQRRASLAINGLVIEGLRQDDPAAASGIRWIRGPSHGWTERLGGHLDRRTHDLQTLGAAEVLTGTSFHLSTGPEDQPTRIERLGQGLVLAGQRTRGRHFARRRHRERHVRGRLLGRARARRPRRFLQRRRWRAFPVPQRAQGVLDPDQCLPLCAPGRERTRLGLGDGGPRLRVDDAHHERCGVDPDQDCDECGGRGLARGGPHAPPTRRPRVGAQERYPVASHSAPTRRPRSMPRRPIRAACVSCWKAPTTTPSTRPVMSRRSSRSACGATDAMEIPDSASKSAAGSATPVRRSA